MRVRQAQDLLALREPFGRPLGFPLVELLQQTAIHLCSPRSEKSFGLESNGERTLPMKYVPLSLFHETEFRGYLSSGPCLRMARGECRLCAERVKEEAKALRETILTSSRRSRKSSESRSFSEDVNLRGGRDGQRAA